MCENKSNNKSSEELKNDLWRTLLCAGLAVFAIWLLSWILIDVFIADSDRGTFGDKFGAINALFSGLAFAGLIVTLLYQKEELKLQREELRETRNELNAQKLEFQEQNKTMKRQRFENTFFNMLSLQQEIVTKLSYTCKRKQKTGKRIPISGAYEYDFVESKYMGREVFEALYNETDVKLKDSNQSYNGGIKSIIKNKGIVEFENICDISNLDHYYRHLYRLFKYVDSSPLITKTKDDDKDEYEERYDYACIIRSQLSDYELVMLFYNCLTSNGRAKFKPLIEKYSIFNNLREELLAKREHKKEYSEKAYDRYAE